MSHYLSKCTNTNALLDIIHIAKSSRKFRICVKVSFGERIGRSKGVWKFLTYMWEQLSDVQIWLWTNLHILFRMYGRLRVVAVMTCLDTNESRGRVRASHTKQYRRFWLKIRKYL